MGFAKGGIRTTTTTTNEHGEHNRYGETNGREKVKKMAGEMVEKMGEKMAKILVGNNGENNAKSEVFKC